MGVTQIRREGQHVPADGVTPLRTCLERPCGEGVAKIMNARPTSMLSRVEANGLQQTTKDPTDGRPIETPPPNGDEQELVLGGDSPAMLKVAVQPSDCRMMERDAPALFEFWGLYVLLCKRPFHDLSSSSPSYCMAN